MRNQLHERLLWREVGTGPRSSSFRSIYGDKTWIDDLDIVNELGGHSGCVNALSWSTSGGLLASGSDDQHLNIHSYQPESSNSPFALTTTVATGHGANIFSVKFMPHSNDRTLVTAAGDAEVRVFDIEYCGRASESTGANIASTARGQRFHNMYKGVRYLSDGNTNARIYRSHADRVKRIVTESSPNLFLTCSEDGEVRQFDLRMPSSAYPPPKGGRGFLAHREDHDDSNVPPPLISYKRYSLDLHTISCSPSQPHYIALGGAHLHCFVHDRRMLGRDFDEARGKAHRASPASAMSCEDEEAMSKATRCVRRFAPEGKPKMGRHDNRHITACKISGANPNELIASWSGDHIYSFDLVRSPDARGQPKTSASTSEGKKAKGKESKDRKRRRNKNHSSSLLHHPQKGSKPRSPETERGQAIRATYENGETEDIIMSNFAPSAPTSTVEGARESVLKESQKRSLQIAKSSVNIRKLIFSLEASPHSSKGSMDPDAHRSSFTSALGFAATSFPEMKQISSSWRYPVDPLEEDVILQQTLRGNRNSSQRFVQAAGTLARSLGGRLQTASQSGSPALGLFQKVLPIQPDGLPLTNREVFAYTFLRAILLWLDGGTPMLLDGFKRPPNKRKNDESFPIPNDADESAIYDKLIPHLLLLAGGSAVIDVDASRFERDETRKIFESEKAAVIAFGNAIRMPLQDLSKAVMPARSSTENQAVSAAQDRKAAMKYWGFKIGRSLLMKAGEGVDFQFVDTAFGGLGNAEIEEDRIRENIELEEDDPVVERATVVRKPKREGEEREVSGMSHTERTTRAGDAAKRPDDPAETSGQNDEDVLMDDLHADVVDRIQANEENAEDDGDSADDDDDDESDEDDDSDADAATSEHPFIFWSAFERRRGREKVEHDVPCLPHTRTYRGHCNVKTVKDADFFGLQDEYVVSGSDGGHLFIWDKKTSELVNILEGDGEVVNVIQGHPYEPLLAVSGIDHTIKIFSPDARAQEDAKNGINISNSTHASQGYSSLSHSGRRRRRGSSSQDAGGNEGRLREGLESRKRMQQSYQIVSQNDVRRQGGMRDAYITRGMLAQVAARLRARHAEGEGDGDGGGDGLGGLVVGEHGEAIVVDDSCSVM